MTPSGYPAPGYVVVSEPSTAIDCATGGPTASPSAIDNDILWCGPSANYAIACWKSHTPSTALCLQNSWSKTLTEIRDSGTPAVTAPKNPQPIGIALHDGDHCKIRDGGAWNRLAGHPNWYGTYSCTKDGAVWGPGTEDGITTTTPIWTATTAAQSGTGPITARDIAVAYFVGTYHG